MIAQSNIQRTLFCALLFLAKTLSAADWVDVEARPDGTSLSYDPTSIQRNGPVASMWHETVWQSAVDCDSSGCTKTARMRYQYDCTHALMARIEYIAFDAAGHERSRKSYRAYFAPVRKDDRSSQALYNAACAKVPGRRQG